MRQYGRTPIQIVSVSLHLSLFVHILTILLSEYCCCLIHCNQKKNWVLDDFREVINKQKLVILMGSQKKGGRKVCGRKNREVEVHN